MLGSLRHLSKVLILPSLMLATSFAEAKMSIERDDKEINLHIRDGLNRLYLEVEIPFHEMGDASKRLAAARAIHFLKQDLAEMWDEGKMPSSLGDLMESSMTLGELQYDKIYDRISEASGAKLRKVIEDAAPELARNAAGKMSGVDWWRPAGILVEVGAKGKFKLSVLKGLSGTFAEVVVPQCVNRIRKIPLQEAEKDGQIAEMLKDRKPSVMDRAYNVILTKFYGRPCTENLEVLMEKLKQKEGAEFYNNYYFVEEAFVKSQRKFLFWADTRVGSKKATTDDKKIGFHGKFGIGVVYGKLTRPEDFLGATLSGSKTFQLPQAARTKVKTFIRTNFPRMNLLTNVNWGLHAKAGALVWKDRFFPYFMMGPEVGTNINSKPEFNPGTVIDLFEFLGSFASNMSESLSAGYSGDSGVREDAFSLEEYAHERAEEMKALQEAPQSEATD